LTPLPPSGHTATASSLILGPYRVGNELGADALGRAALACRTAPTGRPQQVRLCVMYPELAQSAPHVERFLDEARLAMAVQHATMGQVLDAGTIDGVPFAAYAYVGGRSLAEVIAVLRGRPELSERTRAFVCFLLHQVATGLHVVHQGLAASGLEGTALPTGLSPHSVLVAFDGSIRLGGFGARVYGLPGVEPNAQVLECDYPYRAPERVLGGSADRRADVWTLGVMLFEALTGISPFVRPTRDAIDRAITADPLPVLKSASMPLLGEIVSACLQRRPEDRLADCTQVVEVLAQQLVSTGEQAVGGELARVLEDLFGDVAQAERSNLRALGIEEASAYLYSHEGRSDAPRPISSAPGSAAPPTDLWAQPAPSTARAPSPPPDPEPLPSLPSPRRWPWLLGLAAILATGAFAIARTNEEPRAEAALDAELREREGTEVVEPQAPRAVAIDEPAAEPSAPSGVVSGAPTGVPEAPLDTPPSAPASPPIEPAPAEPEPAKPEPAKPEPAKPEPAARAEAPDEKPASSADARRERRRARRESAASEPVAPAPAQAARSTPPSEKRGKQARGEPGTVVIGASDGWAEVYFDGQRLGTTPLRTELPSGQLTLEVRPFGTGTPKRVPVTVKPAETTKVRVAL
jgi:eukaryotic-like serine/threonine-protein kinase